jgi:tryptophanyl-tRNA synthetase
MKPVVFSGIQPTGNGVPHLGNYLGAIRNFPRLQTQGDCLYCVVDIHATTMPHDPKQLNEAILTTAAALLAAGVDPERSILFRQSAVAGHSQLAQVLTNVATMGNLERMTQFKDKSRIDEDGTQRESIGAGLLMYPVLMAADILLYHGTLVPVGEDQKQHLQLTRQLARAFNHRFKIDFFAEPREIVPPDAPRIMSLRDPLRKMSKSSASSPEELLFLTDTADQAAKKIKRATSETDALPSEEAGLDNRPAAANLTRILAALTERTVGEVLTDLGGQGFSALKSAIIDAYVAEIVPVGERMRGLLADEHGLRHLLIQGNYKANHIASRTISQVNQIMGFETRADAMAELSLLSEEMDANDPFNDDASLAATIRQEAKSLAMVYRADRYALEAAIVAALPQATQERVRPHL